MSGLHALSGPSPFGGECIAAKRGWSTYRDAVPKKEEEMPKRKRRSTADEAAVKNKTEFLDHAHFASGDRTFNVCCLKAGVMPTKRQASKFKRGTGAAAKQLALLTDEDYA